MKQFEQTYTIQAPVAKVWQAFTDAGMAEQWGAAPAKVDARIGGDFSYWGGDIHGTFTKLLPQMLIEQDWYGHDHPERKFKAVFVLMESDKGTSVQLTFSGDIEDEQRDIKDWQEYYFSPIKELLEDDHAA